MEASNEAIAEAFSRHDFPATYEHMAGDVRWELVGQETLVGRDQVVARCGQMAVYLAQARTSFRRFRLVESGDRVVIDAVAEYASPEDGRSIVASCDIYEFEDGRLLEITSYNVEIGKGHDTE
jgi:ketosteroid isomerase-like protein